MNKCAQYSYNYRSKRTRPFRYRRSPTLRRCLHDRCLRQILSVSYMYYATIYCKESGIYKPNILTLRTKP